MRKLLMVSLALGAISGFALGFRHLGCHTSARQREFEAHVAETCAAAAERVYERRASPKGVP